jgi:hypothetical protein
MIFMAHSGLRYLVLLLGVLAVVLAIGALRAGPTSGAGRTAAQVFRVFVVLLDIQVLLGIAVVFTRPFVPLYIGHIVMMVLALGLAHVLSAQVKRRAPEQRSPALILAGAGVPLLLVLGGIMALGRPVL